MINLRRAEWDNGNEIESSPMRKARYGVYERPAIMQDTGARQAANPPSEGRRLRQELRQAVREGNFSLAFQARRRLSDNGYLGEDAQLRWSARGRGVVQANTFMPMVEECGLTAPVTEWTLAAACQAATARQDGVISITLPGSVAADASLLMMVGDALQASDLPPERLEIAMPEDQVCGDCATTLMSLSALRDLGIGVALDDFGRAGACLIKLKRLPLTAVKLDRSLLRDMVADRAAAFMVRAAIDFAHALDVDVVASGVETEAQRSLLRHIGCDSALERHVHGAPASHDPGRARMAKWQPGIGHRQETAPGRTVLLLA
jgi:EAL domain-containing protein (putative c-di-GMP-specific phosphodiesterase class I)